MQLTTFFRELGHPVAYYAKLSNITGSVTATVLLCQLLYWEGKQSNPNRWIYKTQAEIQEETGLSRTEQETARKHLKSAGLLQERFKGIPRRLEFLTVLDEIDRQWEDFLATGQSSALSEKQKRSIEKVKHLHPEITSNPHGCHIAGNQQAIQSSINIQASRKTADIYTENTSTDYSINQSNNQSVNQALKVETFSTARENESDILDDLNQHHHGSGNSSSADNQSDQSHSPQSQSNQTDRSHSSGVGESEKKNTVSPRNSLKKEKSVGFKQDEWGIVQLPRAPKYRLASLLATRTMQFLIARDYIECEFAIDRDGDVWILDPKDGDWATEQEVFAGYKDEYGEKVQPTLPLKKLIALVNGSSDEYGPLNIEWYNNTIKQWFMFWKSECERLGDEMVSVVQRKSIGVWMQKALDLEFYEYEEVA